MFHFNRRTLWIILYISIALIFLLNQLGPQTDEGGDATTPAAWSLDAVAFERDGPYWRVELAGARQLRLTIIQSRLPTEPQPSAPPEALRTSRQGGQFLVTVTDPARPDTLAASVDYLVDWLPDGIDRRLAVSGPLTAELTEVLAPLTGRLEGDGEVRPPRPASAVDRLRSPPMGTREQLAFLLWIGVLQQRLGGYQSEVRWDHRAEVSEVLFSQSLNPALFEPVTEAELAPVLEAYRASAAVRERSAEQIHRYLVTTAVYDLPVDFLLNQQARLAEIDLAAVNRQRQRSREQL